MSIRGTTPVFDSDKLDNKDSSQYLQQTDILQTTGQSTTDTMSQKAITDALANAGGGGSSARTYEEIFGDGNSTEFLITHNLNDEYPHITIIEIMTGDRYLAQIQYIDANSFMIFCDSNYTPADDSMKVIVRSW